MERSIYRFSLDIRDSMGGCQLEMKQGDTHRRLHINLTDGGVPYPIGDGCRVAFTAKKPDGTVIYNTCAVENNTVIYDITPQTTASAGVVSCELQLYDATAEPMALITSAAFGIRVHPRVYNESDTPASEAESTGISAMLQKAEQTVALLEQARDSGQFDGMSATHSWNGTVLTVTSASGTTSSDLRGEKGDPGIVNMDDTAVGAGAWSSKNIVDHLCTGFSVQGPVVTCQPLAGYPLEVVSNLEAKESGHPRVTLTQCGKNLFDYTKYPFENIYITWHSGVHTESSSYSASKDYIPCFHLRGTTITVNHSPTEFNAATNAGLAFYDADKAYITGTNGYTIAVPENAYYFRFSVPRAYADGTQIQIELGDTVTEYEPYTEKTYTVALDATCNGGSFDWSTGLLTVTHKAVALSSLDWQLNENDFYFYADLPDAAAGAALCDHLNQAHGRYDDITNGCYSTDEPDCVFDIADGAIAVVYTGIDSEEDFIAEMGSLEAMLTYPLAEPCTLYQQAIPITAKAGTNTLYSSTGTTTVTGRADPVTIIENLTNAILSLGGNI